MALSVFDVLDAATVPQKFSQCRFAFHIGSSPEILCIVHQKVESAGTRALIVNSTMQRIELRHAIPVEPNHFGVKNGRALNPCCVLNNQRVAFRPIRAIDRVELHT